MIDNRTWMEQLLAPLVFLRINFGGRVAVAYLIPLVLAVGCGLLFWCYPEANVTDDRGLFDVSASLLSMLVGFFAAGLGVALTVNSTSLDSTPNHNPPRLDGEGISWRRFLTYSMAHLVLVSLAAYVLALVVLVSRPSSVRWVAALGGIYTGMLAHILGVTLLALFLLSDIVPGLRQPRQRKRAKKRAQEKRPP